MKLAELIFKRNGWYVTSAFGPRKDPLTGKLSQHSGADYGTKGEKWPLYAIEDGTVISCDSGPIYGNQVWVNYPRIGKKLFLGHMSSFDVKAGQKVKEGTLLGRTGTTGRSTGIHLHLGMQPSAGGAWQDPHAYDYKPASPKAEKPAVAIPAPTPTKSIDDIAREVIRGNWGVGDERKKKLAAAGYDYATVQRRVNEMLKN